MTKNINEQAAKSGRSAGWVSRVLVVSLVLGAAAMAFLTLS